MNVIPEGALHARLNHMDNKDFTKRVFQLLLKMVINQNRPQRQKETR